MNLSLINPYIRLAMESRIPSGHNIAQRVIYDYELIYLEEGNFTFVYNGEAYYCKTGDIFFICPGIAHSFYLDYGEISQPHIHFDITHRPQSEFIPISFKDLDKMSDAEREWIHKDYYSTYKHTPLLDIQNKPEFFEAFYKIVSGHLDDLTKKSLMIKLIAIITTDNFPKLLQSNTRLNVANQIKDYIDAGNGMGMTLDNFSKIFFYDKFYMERKFKEAFGINIIEYRNKKRMEFAKDLLKINSVSRVSEMLGYQSVY
ncbi:MAG: AraC family ligand binding domain-containing protein, partial [Clostridia bacterium]|nr:AraC family ligand binding domain-containing protein [Clostridia bacterium]